MSEEQNIQDQATGKDSSRTKPEEGKKEPFKKMKSKLPKNSNNFNFYWIYVVILVGLALMWFPNFTDTVQPIEWREFVETVLKPGDVKKIVVVNEQTAEITIKKERLSEAKYEKVRIRPITKEENPGPHYVMKSSKESFARDL